MPQTQSGPKSKLSAIMPDTPPLVRNSPSSASKVTRGRRGLRQGGTRIIQGLISAAPCQRPDSIPEARPRGKAKRAGLSYEAAAAKALCSLGAKHGQWFAFVDQHGSGYCQTDLLLEAESWVAVLESKLTWTPQGHVQIDKLYKPVVARAKMKRTFGLVICKTLTTQTDLSWVTRDLESALHRASLGLPTVLHWLGVGLGPLQLAPGFSHLAIGTHRL